MQSSSVGSAGAVARLAAAFDYSASLLDQAATALAVAMTNTTEFGPVDDPADMPVGLADRALLSLREQLTGSPLEHTVSCPGCGAYSTLTLAADQVPPHVYASRRVAPGLGVREPTYADLIAADGDVQALLARCSVGRRKPQAPDGEGPETQLSDLAAIEGSLSGPLLSSCPECGDSISADVDVLSLVLADLAQVCAGFDHDTHVLAARYGWTPPIIEALPDARRRRLALLAEAAL